MRWNRPALIENGMCDGSSGGKQRHDGRIDLGELFVGEVVGFARPPALGAP